MVAQRKGKVSRRNLCRTRRHEYAMRSAPLFDQKVAHPLLSLSARTRSLSCQTSRAANGLEPKDSAIRTGASKFSRSKSGSLKFASVPDLLLLNFDAPVLILYRDTKLRPTQDNANLDPAQCPPIFRVTHTQKDTREGIKGQGCSICD